jgi:hypothetical protein
MDNAIEEYVCRKCNKSKPTSEFNFLERTRCKECSRQYRKDYRQKPEVKAKERERNNSERAKQVRKQRRDRLRREQYEKENGIEAETILEPEQNPLFPVMVFTDTLARVFRGDCEVIAVESNIAVATRIGIPRFCCILMIVLSRRSLVGQKKFEYFLTEERRNQATSELFGKNIKISQVDGLTNKKREASCNFFYGDYIYRAYCRTVFPEALPVHQVEAEASVFAEFSKEYLSKIEC